VTRRRADAVLLLATALWGVSFPAVKIGLGYASPLAFLALRFALGALVLAPGTALRPAPGGRELAAGLLLAGLLAVGFAFQVVGLVYTTPARSAFIVAVSSVLAPVVAFVVLGQRTRWWTLGALALAGVGIYLLTAPGAGGLNRGDALTFGTALVFGGHIVAVAEFSTRYDARRLVWMQTAGTALGAGVAMLVLEDVRIRWTGALAGALGYTAVFATALALLWQMRAQRYMSSARAALIFCFEPVFAAAASWLWLGERLSVSQFAGGALILVAMILADLPAAASWRRTTFR